MNPVIKAALWMSGAIVSFSSMAVAGRELSSELDTFEIMTYRSIIGVCVVVSIAALSGHLGDIKFRNLRLHALRNFVHFIGQNLWFLAVALMVPLAQVFALEFTSPIWVALLSPLILRERLTPMRALAALMGFVGILIVARPSPETIDTGILAAAGAAIAFALTSLFTKKLTRTENVTSIVFFLTSMQAIFGLITSGYDLDIALPSQSLLPYVVIVGVAGLFAQFCLTKALSLAPATVVVPLDFARLPVIAVVGMILYNEPLDGLVFLGAAVIFAGNYLNIWSETRAPRKVA
ncbi:DMT family transporter [Aquicoccus sp. G2-2]|uniref:DMT family transporter n=1 Tax=Aquicoccus sp. G2-2 TaxID=3092120 RepID=UPI002AE000B0|nr:DMT family transporter [Aquicoccus sp. G2-2]MEA1113084.1 DMT family transporter [Aquicoccus sp. G2-2]